MTYSILISDEAYFDISEAYLWYETIENKLAQKFEKDLETAISSIQSNPNKFQLKYKTVRVVFMKKFPFGIHFIKNEATVIIVALFHTSRNPNNWNERLKDK